MSPNRSHSWSFSFIFGVLIVAAGVVLLLDQQGIINADRVFSYFWPVIMIAAGSAMLIDCRGRGGRGFWGIWLLAIGLILMLENLGVAHAVLIRHGVEGELDALDRAIVVPHLERLRRTLRAAGDEPRGHQKMAAHIHVESHRP